MFLGALALPMAQPSARSATFEATYEAHRLKVYRLALRFGGGSRAFAEDLAHDVFVRLLEKIDTLDSGEDLGGWLYRVTTNLALKKLRREKSFLGLVARLFTVTDAPAADSVFEGKQAAAQAMKAIDGLPPNERVVMLMLLVDGLKQAEIADTLSMSKGYVSKLVARATEKLRAAGWEVPS
jgi:RNA polymerase sigma-70 factor, ECF subfamily